METLQIPNEVKEMLHYAEGKTLQEKLMRLVVDELLRFWLFKLIV